MGDRRRSASSVRAARHTAASAPPAARRDARGSRAPPARQCRATGMRRRELFAGVKCHVCADGLAPSTLLALECALREGGAALLDEAQRADWTHVVCLPRAFAAFGPARDGRFLRIVRPEWVFRSLLLQSAVLENRFSADPALFFSGLAIAAGPVEKDPRKVIDGLIAHFGGQIVGQQEVYAGATHVLSPEDAASPSAISLSPPEHLQLLNLSYSDADVARAAEAWRQSIAGRIEGGPATFELPSCLVAFMGEQAGLTAQFRVSYGWIEECVRRKTRVPEGAFAVGPSAAVTSSPVSWKSRPVLELEDLHLSKCSAVYQLAHTEYSMELSMLSKSTERLADMQTALSGAIVLLAQHIPPTLKESLLKLLQLAKAKVANVPLGDSYQDIVRKVVANASFVVCCYRAGFEYEEAVRQQKRVVSIFWVLDGGHFAMSSNEQSAFVEAIERPMVSHGGIPGMRSFVITLSGYTSRTRPTRDQVQIAISATGACMLPVLSRTHSTHLLCYEPVGEKFKKAKSWRFDNILSHKWLFDCLTEWRYLDEDTYRYVAPGKPVTKPSSDTSASNRGNGANEIVDAAENDKTRTSKVSASDRAPTSTATTPVGLQRATKNGRFDVDDLLTELDHTTPQDKKSAVADAQAKEASKTAANDAACLLFDTPSKTMLAQDGADPKEPEPEADASTGETKIASAGKSKQSRGSAGSKKGGKRSTGDSLKDESGASSDKKDLPAKKAASSSKKTSSTATGRKRKASASVSADNSEAVVDDQSKEESSESKKKAAKHTKTSAAGSLSDSSAKAAAKKTGHKGSDFVFLLTGTREEMAVNESIVLVLGGKVSSVERRFDITSTHIICSELKRTEKFVAGCASGKWILKPSYLEASSKAGRFVDEVDHEWGGNPQDKALMDDRIWPCAPSFWRTARAAGKPGAFAGWRVLVHAKCHPPADMCERIVAAGDGTLVPMTKATDLAALASEASEQLPVVALLPADLPARDAWLKKLKASKVECVSASFLIDFLTKKQAPPVSRAQYQL